MRKITLLVLITAVAGLVVACGAPAAPAATSTSAPAATSVPSTATLEPPTATLVPPTATTAPPTATMAAPMATETPATVATEAPTAVPTSGQPTVDAVENSSLGKILVDAKGFTLYQFKNDTAGVSNCTGACANLWPPLTVAQGVQPVLAQGIPGTLGTIQRSDGSYQVTYTNMPNYDQVPLYDYSGDSKAGETNGEGLYNLWYVVSVSASSAAAAPTATLATTGTATVQAVDNSSLGKILVDAKGFTLYLFKNDTAGVSNCTDACANAWPPLTVAQSVQPALAPGIPGTLGTIQRSDGSYQVTYTDMPNYDQVPLYYFSGDSKAGDTNGEGLYNLWYVVSVTGQ